MDSNPSFPTGGAKQPDQDRYPYLDNLLGMERMVPLARPTFREGIDAVSTPLRWEAWAKELEAHPDKAYAAFIVGEIQNGFRIGFNYSSHSCTCSGRNMISAKLHPLPIQAYIERERAAGRIIGPLSDVTGVQISRLGVIPKPHQVGKWRHHRLVLPRGSQR